MLCSYMRGLNLSLLYTLPFSLSGNFCPLCDKCYDEDDYDSKMMQCGRCNHWVHAKCENLTGECSFSNHQKYCLLQMWSFISPILSWSMQLTDEMLKEYKLTSRMQYSPVICCCLVDEMYELLSKLPESVAYTCTKCTDHHPAEWRTALEKELQGCVRHVLTALLNSRTSTHLLRYRQVRYTLLSLCSRGLCPKPCSSGYTCSFSTSCP